MRMLQRRKQGQRRLGALVEVRPARCEAVEATPGVRVPHDMLSVVVSEEPGLCGAETVDPAPGAVDGRRAGAGVGERGHFNGLLVERRPVIAGSCAAYGRDGQVTVHRLVVK